MSIISDALKKAEELRKTSKGDQPAEAEPIETREKTFKSIRNLPWVYGLGALMLITAIATSIYLISKAPVPAQTKTGPTLDASHQELTLVPQVSPEADEKVAVLSPAAPSPQSEVIKTASESTPLPSLTLNGIMCSSKTRYAIINNGMVLEGEAVGGARVERIDRNEVLLKYEGRDFTLKLKK